MGEIDLSAGLIPKQQGGIDLSAGLVQKQSSSNGDSHAGVLSKMWDWANDGLIGKDTIVRAISGMTPDDLNKALAPYSGESAAHAGVREFVRGAIQDTGQTASGFTSPLAVGTMGLGAAGKIPGAVGTIAKVAAPVVAGAFGVQGAKQVYDAGTENTPEAWQQRLQGGAMVAGGVAGGAEGMKSGAQAINPRGILADRMAQTPPGERFSRQEVFDAAKKQGVNLDLAQATDSGAANAIKKANSVSIAGKGVIEDSASKNVDALQKWADSEATKYSPEGGDRQIVGGQMQQALKSHLDARQGAATQLFNDLDRNVSGVKPDATSVYDKAKEIVAENKDYYDKNPALKQGRAWQIVNDLANREEATKPSTSTVKSSLVDESGQPFSKEVKNRPQVKPDTWQDLQKLRTDVMSEYRSPDVVGTRAEGWLKQLAAEIDNSMTGAGSGLSGPDLSKFRHANEIWTSIKNTYDNPQSPYYHAVRSQFPSQVPGMLSRGTPELAASVRQTLGSLEGPFQRQFVENILNDKSGNLDFKNLNSRLSRVPDDHLKAMLGDEGAKNLRLLGKVAQKVTADANPSGTAKTAVPVGEITTLIAHPVLGAAELGANYGSARALTNPRFVDFMTKKKQP